jgi:hypothetical protein
VVSLGLPGWSLAAPSEARWDQVEAETVAAPSEDHPVRSQVAPSEERRFRAAPSEAQWNQVEASLGALGPRQEGPEQ